MSGFGRIPVVPLAEIPGDQWIPVGDVRSCCERCSRCASCCSWPQRPNSYKVDPTILLGCRGMDGDCGVVFVSIEPSPGVAM